jgi:DNA-binding IclR family transcriptional regulator
MPSNVFQTLSDPSGLRIVEALLAGERAVNDVVDHMDIHQSGVSRHLRILEEAAFGRMAPSACIRSASSRFASWTRG